MSHFASPTYSRANPLHFGRRTPFVMASSAPTLATQWSNDVRLFAATFAAGFIVVSALIA